MASLADRLVDVLASVAAAVKDARRGYAGGGPPVGWQLSPLGVLSVGTGMNTTAGRIYLHAIDVPIEAEWDAISYGITTARVAGTTVALTAAMYASDAAGWIDLASGPVIGPVVLADTSTGNKVATVTPVRLKPGRYWTATLYTYASAPTTHVAMSCDSNNAQGIPRPTSQPPSGGAIRGYYLAGPYSSIGAIEGNPTMNVSGNTDVPVLGLRRSA